MDDTRLRTLETKVADLESVINNTKINRDTDIEYLDDVKNVIFESIADYLWDGLYIISSFEGPTVTMSSSTENVTIKEVDNSEGRTFDPRKPSKCRLNFYLGSGQTNSTVYLLSPAVSKDPAFGTNVPLSTNTHISYVGIKIIQTIVYLVSYDHFTGAEKLIRTDKTVTDDTTHTLEINYRPGESADIHFDNQHIGSIECNLIKDASITTFYPYLTSIKSASGSVNLTLEQFQFLQAKK